MKMYSILFFFLITFSLSYDNVPLPWNRTIQLKTPYVNGSDIYTMQHLLLRSKYVPGFVPNSLYDEVTQNAVIYFQKGHSLSVELGIFESKTANILLKLHTYDGYKVFPTNYDIIILDDGRSAGEQGYLYKVIVPVYSNRSIETPATLLDKNNKILLNFTARTHGASYPGVPWPDYNSSSPGLCLFCNGGNTPTGLVEIDLNTPEGQPKFYGPYPVNRWVKGLEGNAQILIPNTRNGILLHTGEVSNGVEIHNNSQGKLPYPYVPQGIMSVYQID